MRGGCRESGVFKQKKAFKGENARREKECREEEDEVR